ncbi:MAG: right-handed parallel beta-helix repeat-containing protein [Sphingobacteriaceae bacterium]|nr:right-handed parallel beta-helix repeat-containing protein [Sphingobacteriaceae bacterium]
MIKPFYLTLLLFCSAVTHIKVFSVNDMKLQNTYYVDAVNGKDANNGITPHTPWKTLKKVNSAVFKPGDKLLFRAGTNYNGQLKVHGSGKAGRPIIIDKYGEGFKPRIRGQARDSSALLLFNVEYWTVRNLDISNYGSTPKPSRYGVWVKLLNFGTAHSIVLSNLEIHDVNGSLVKKEGGGAGILCSNEGNIPSRFDSLVIENCTIKRCHRNGILINGNWERNNWFPNKKVVIRKNLIEGVPGDGIVPVGCDSALIEYNVMRDCPRLLPDGEAAAGIWPWSSDNTIIQYNEVSDHKAPWDAQGFDSDWNCRNTVIQYNYSHDNEGGFLLICNDGSAGKKSSIGNNGTIVRYNLSVNDGFRNSGKHAGFSPIIHVAGPVKNTLVYNNVFYINSKARNVDSALIDITDWQGFADSTVFANNIFYANTAVKYRLSKGTRTIFENNIYYGRHLDKPKDSFAIVDDPVFLIKEQIGLPGLKSALNFRISQKSPGRAKGKIMISPVKDFFGNQVSHGLKPSIGLHQAD